MYRRVLQNTTKVEIDLGQYILVLDPDLWTKGY